MVTYFKIFLKVTLRYSNNSNKNKEAHELAAQTDAFAKIFAVYMNKNYDNLNQMRSGSVTVRNSDSPGLDWPNDISKTNMYQQKPCVVIAKNATDLEAIMFYTTSNKDISKSKVQVIRNAALLLGNKGGVLEDGNVKEGNSGWHIDNSSIFWNNVSQCGGTIPAKSIVVNMDMMPEWNQDLQPNIAVDRTLDDYDGQFHLPGHLYSSNTVKSNIYFAENKGIILDDTDSNNQVKLVLNKDSNPHSALISLSKNSKTLIADIMQSKQQYFAGTSCFKNELGKIILDQGSSNNTLNAVLARSTLICSNNEALCSNPDKTCYLPTQPNTVTFQNNSEGIQNSNGEFYCPKEVPFAINATSNVGNMVPVYHNGSLECKIAWESYGDCGGNMGEDIPFPIYVKALKPDYWVKLQGNSGSYIQGAINNYLVATGYRVTNEVKIDYNAVFVDICHRFNEKSCDVYQYIKTFTDQNTKLTYHWRMSIYDSEFANFDAIQDTAAANAIITSVTCSNMPTYFK